MNFEDFIREGKVRRSSLDKELAKSLLQTARQDLLFLKDIPITDLSARKVLISYYDTLRSILEAITALEGYKVYSHEAFYFFLITKKEDLLATKFDRFRKLRNKLNYYGGTITTIEVEENKQEIEEMITFLIKRYFP